MLCIPGHFVCEDGPKPLSHPSAQHVLVLSTVASKVGNAPYTQNTMIVSALHNMTGGRRIASRLELNKTGQEALLGRGTTVTR